jgi:hypothetical protein
VLTSSFLGMSFGAMAKKGERFQNVMNQKRLAERYTSNITGRQQTCYCRKLSEIV